MKVRSLLLGSVAAAGLSTGAFAADLGVLTSLDVCDALGLSGLTISSETNCLQITGGIAYEFRWGDYEGDSNQTTVPVLVPGALDVLGPFNDGLVQVGADGNKQFTLQTPGNATLDGVNTPALNHDWYSKVDAFIKFVATADSSFGPAKAVIKIKDFQEFVTVNERPVNGKVSPFSPPQDVLPVLGAVDGVPGTGGDHTFGPIFDEAYVSVGDSTVLMAGKKGTIMNLSDDVPLNILGLFNDEAVDRGVKWSKNSQDRGLGDGGHVIQITSDLGNGFSISGGLEKLDASGPAAGTAVGVLAYAGDGISAHITGVAGGILDGVVEAWGYHAGFSGTFDMFKIVAAAAGDDTGYFNGLASASVGIDIFTLAASVEVVNVTTQTNGNGTDFGVGGSISAAVTDGITVNLSGRWYRDANTAALATVDVDDGYQVEASLVAAVTETLTLTGAIGAFGDIEPATANVLNPTFDPTYYGTAEVAWAPGGDFTASLKGQVQSNGSYRITTKAAKKFE